MAEKKKMLIGAVIQARMASTRLPGKVLMNVLKKPLLSYMIDRVHSCNLIQKVIVATTVNSIDDCIVRLCENRETSVFRGSEHNVLERFYQAAKKHELTDIVRLTADCPLVDPELLDDLIHFYMEGKYDYASNCMEPTLPDGLDAEIFRVETLEAAYNNAFLPSHIEHVTPYIRENPDQFKIGKWHYKIDLSGLRWTVDEPEDFVVVREIIETLFPEKPNFRLQDVLNLLDEKPQLMKINSHIDRNAGYMKSLEKDKNFR